MRSKLKATSSAVIGVPSLNVTPLRMVNVRDRFSGPHRQEVASQGVALPLRSALTKASGS